MTYPDSFMEWVVGAPITRPKPRRARLRSPMRRVVVHVETTDSDYVSDDSVDEPVAQKKVHFEGKQKLKPALKKTKKQEKASAESDDDAKSVSSQGSKPAEDSGKEESANSTPEKSAPKARGEKSDKSEEAKCCSCHATTEDLQQIKGKQSKKQKSQQSQEKKSDEESAHPCLGCAQKAKENQKKEPLAPNQGSQLVHRNFSMSSNLGFNLDGRGYLTSDQIKQAMDRYVQSRGGSVVIREDVIEGPNDPRPNAFYDSNSNTLRVYHGASYGNPYSALVPNNVHYMPVGTAPPHGGQSAPYVPPMGSPYTQYPPNYYNNGGHRCSPYPLHAYPAGSHPWPTPQMRNRVCSPRMNSSNAPNNRPRQNSQNGNSNNKNNGNNNQPNPGRNHGNSRDQNGNSSRHNNLSLNHNTKENTNGNNNSNQSSHNQESTGNNDQSDWNNVGSSGNEASAWDAGNWNDNGANQDSSGNDPLLSWDNMGDSGNDQNAWVATKSNDNQDNSWGAPTEPAPWGDPTAAQSTGGQSW